MKKIYIIKCLLSILLGMLVVITSLFDFYTINNNIEEYQIVYHISEYSSDWQYKNVSNFKCYNLSIAIIFIIYAIINVILLVTKNKKLLYIILFIDLLLIISVFYDLYKWMAIGFDHY